MRYQLCVSNGERDHSVWNSNKKSMNPWCYSHIQTNFLSIWSVCLIYRSKINKYRFLKTACFSASSLKTMHLIKMPSIANLFAKMRCIFWLFWNSNKKSINPINIDFPKTSCFSASRLKSRHLIKIFLIGNLLGRMWCMFWLFWNFDQKSINIDFFENSWFFASSLKTIHPIKKRSTGNLLSKMRCMFWLFGNFD